MSHKRIVMVSLLAVALVGAVAALAYLLGPRHSGSEALAHEASPTEATAPTTAPPTTTTSTTSTTTTLPPPTTTTAPVVVLTNPLDLRATLQSAAVKTIGRVASEQDVQDFANWYQAQESGAQTGASQNRPPDQYNAAVTFLTERYPDDAQRKALGDRLDEVVPTIICALDRTAPGCPQQ
jgi:hypothetical protein